MLLKIHKDKTGESTPNKSLIALCAVGLFFVFKILYKYQILHLYYKSKYFWSKCEKTSLYVILRGYFYEI